ncbi:MAG: hypothetical protein D6751_08850 [Deltaproteobacteria bacterium]|nr:MAG: hypothetical protein D6751_08850 [Deltaproteobacteria bacterium]
MLKYLRLYYLLVALPYLLMLTGAWVFYEPLRRTIAGNRVPHLNYAIIVIVLLGGLFILLNARRLVREARNLRLFMEAVRNQEDSSTLRQLTAPMVGALANLLQMMAASCNRSISHQEQAALEHEQVNVRTLLVRRNALPQYLTGLLVAMGLLGTFIGLLATLADISVLIGSFADIDMQHTEPIQVFRMMIERLKAPMSSMGIAFSTSMFGLLGSIVIGLMMLGIRRLQGDIMSTLASELARHIENALSFEAVSLRGAELALADGEALDAQSRILLRIDERLAEAARTRQRQLAAEIDDFRAQRKEMLQTLQQQAESNAALAGRIEQVGHLLATLTEGVRQADGTLSSQLSELRVQLESDANRSQELLQRQVARQEELLQSLAGLKLGERVEELARRQQQLHSDLAEDFRAQRGEMRQALERQSATTEAHSRSLDEFARQLGAMSEDWCRQLDDIAGRISDQTAQAGADAKETHRLQTASLKALRSELQQLGQLMDNRIGKLRQCLDEGQAASLESLGTLQESLVREQAAVRDRIEQVGGGIREQIAAGTRELADLGRTESVALQEELARQADRGSEERNGLRQALFSVGKGLREDVRQGFDALQKPVDQLVALAERGDPVVAERIELLRSQLAAEARTLQSYLSGEEREALASAANEGQGR